MMRLFSSTGAPEVTGHPPEETRVEPRLGSVVGPGEELTQKIDEGAMTGHRRGCI